MNHPALPPANAPIGVFDSGVGGLSVLRHIHALLPHEQLIYFADSGFAPYGDKSEQLVAERALAIAGFLVERGVKALVVACNTATVAAIKALRGRYPDMPIVGVEPGLKPGAAATRNGKVGVLATEGTLAGDKFLQLRALIGSSSRAEFVLQGCPGLADQIERGEFDTPATLALLEAYLLPLLRADVDTLVLGCTHYPFAQAAIERMIAAYASQPVTLIDTGAAVARQLQRLLDGAGLLRTAGGAALPIEGYASSDAGAPALAAAFASLLRLQAAVGAVNLDGGTA